MRPPGILGMTPEVTLLCAKSPERVSPQPNAPAASGAPATVDGMEAPGSGSKVLSLRIDAELLERVGEHAAKRGMSVQDYVLRTLMRDDFDERFKSAVTETQRFYAG